MQDVAHVLASVPMFAGVDAADLRRLAAESFPRQLARGQVLFREGERSEHLHVVGRGRVKVLVSSPQGDELVLAVLHPGDAFGELSVLDGTARSAGAVAVDEVMLWCVPAEQVRALLQRSPAAALGLAEELAATVRRLTGAAADLVFLDLPHRLAKLLLADDAAGTRTAALTQTDIAAQLGVTRQSLNRALQRLQERGWIEVTRTGIVVLDPLALTGFAQS